MRIIVRQADKTHDTNQLHDALIAAGFDPWPVESTPEESRFFFDDEADEMAISVVIEGFVPTEVAPPPTPGSIIAALAAIDLGKVNTLEDLKAAIAPAVAAAALVVAVTEGPQ